MKITEIHGFFFLNPCSFFNTSVFIHFSYSLYSFVSCFRLWPFRCSHVLSFILALLFLYILSLQTNLHLTAHRRRHNEALASNSLPEDQLTLLRSVWTSSVPPGKYLGLSRPFHFTSLPIHSSLIILQFDVVYFMTHSIDKDHVATW